MKQNQVLITIIVAILVGGIAFFGGMQYQKSKAPTAMANGQFQNLRGANGGARRNGFGGATVGTIASIDASSLTIKLMDGSSKVVDLAGSTTYSKTTSGTKSDLTVGTRVAAIGSTNSDGSITAQNVQINPMFRGPGGGQGVQPSPAQGSGY